MIEHNTLKINEEEKLCYINDEPVTLSKSEYNTILFLMSNPNKVFTREELIENIWTSTVTNRAVDTTIARLRSKLGDYSKNIYTRLGFGYGFTTKI